MLVGLVDPQIMEAGLSLDLLSIGDDGPSFDVGEEQVDSYVVVSNEFFRLSSIYCTSTTCSVEVTLQASTASLRSYLH